MLKVLLVAMAMWLCYYMHGVWKSKMQHSRIKQLQSLKLQIGIIKRGFKINSCNMDNMDPAISPSANLAQMIANSMLSFVDSINYMKKLIVNNEQNKKYKHIFPNMVKEKQGLLKFIKDFEKKHDVDILQNPSLDKGHLIVDVSVCADIKSSYVLYMKLFGRPPVTGWDESKLQQCINILNNASNQCTST